MRHFYHYNLNNRFIVSPQSKKNAKVKDRGRVKYIAMKRRTPPAGAEAAICVYPSRSAVSESCQGKIIYQSKLSHHSCTKQRWKSDCKSMTRWGGTIKEVCFRDIKNKTSTFCSVLYMYKCEYALSRVWGILY